MAGFNLKIQPDKIDPEAAEILVDVFIDTEKYEFLLDTGAARTTIEYDNYTSRFKQNKTDKSSGVFKTAVNNLIIIPKISLGSVTKYDFQIVRMPKDQIKRKNLIGMDFLKDHSYQFLFERNFVSVDPKIDASYSKLTQDLFLDKRSHPYIKVEILKFGGTNALWDTGAGITIADINFIKNFPQCFSKIIRSSKGTDSTGTSMETPIYKLKSLIIGDQSFSSIVVAGVDLSQINTTLILGYNLIRSANWFFDFPHKQWAILKLPNQNKL